MAKKSKEPSESGSVPHASREDLQAFLRDVAKVQKSFTHDYVVVRQQALRAYLNKHYDRKTLQGFMLRAYGDAFKSPSQKLGTAKAPSGDRPRTGTKKPAGGERTRRPGYKKSRRRPR